MSLMEIFKNSDKMHDLSLLEKLAGAGITTLMGMGITFVVLLLLWVCIVMMNKLLNIGGSRRNKGEGSQESAAVVPETNGTPTSSEEGIGVVSRSEEELVAVISAAIVAAQGDKVVSNLVVKRISRVSPPANIWASAGRMDCVDSRKI